LRWLILLTLALSTSVLAQEDAGVTVAPSDAGVDLAIFVMALESNPGAAQYTPTTLQTLAYRMSSAKVNVLTPNDIAAALGRERQAQLLGCTEGTCMLELGQAMGARYIVSGRLDKLGDQYVLTSSMFDSQTSRAIGRTRQEVDEPEKLPVATKAAADELLKSLGVSAPLEPEPPKNVMANSGFNLSFKLGTQFFTSLVALAPQLDLEFGWRFSRAWSIFLQISTGIQIAQTVNFTVTPGLLGVRHNFRSDASLQPFLGGGIGLFGAILQGFRVRPAVVLLGGLQYFFWERFGLSAEASVDVLGAAFELTELRTGGVNFGFSLGIQYRF
jgi:hypothetical protein